MVIKRAVTAGVSRFDPRHVDILKRFDPGGDFIQGGIDEGQLDRWIDPSIYNSTWSLMQTWLTWNWPL